MHWREWFAHANRLSWQAMELSQDRVKHFIEADRPNCTETMYQAFKARLMDETNLTATTTTSQD